MAALAAAGLLCWWLFSPPTQKHLALRVPGTDNAPGSEFGPTGNAVTAGKRLTGPGQASKLAGEWAQFRGPNRDGLSPETGLLRTWPVEGPRELWGVDAGEGYAGPVISAGRVYLMDYDREKKEDALRCLSLDDGREIWRYSYPVAVKRNHGMSRTVPAVVQGYVVAIGPKCHVVCADATTGDLKWGIDLVKQFGATVPPWYAGQCPLIEDGKVILAPGGKDALLVAVDLKSGDTIWKTPNSRGWRMTHSSLTPFVCGGERMYVYCANNGVIGVSAKDGSLLWETAEWKISIATVPSPLSFPDGKVFLSGGYNAGSELLEIQKGPAGWTARTAWRLPPEIFGATQHTPILYNNYIFGVRPDGRFACITPDGKPVWASEATQLFGLGSFLVADGLIFAVNDSGLLRLIEASPQKYHLLAQAQMLKGRESWGPMALAAGRLLVRDLNRLVCLQVGGPDSLHISRAE